MTYLIGQGSDTHELVVMKDGAIILGGHKFIAGYRVISHSDGDLVLHSIANAILGAMQKGDIGQYFKDTDQKIKGICSAEIIKFALNLLSKSKFELVNIDLTITCENILLGDIKKHIQNALIKLLGCKFINVKATRFEKPSNLISCDVVLLINKK
ncbi:MAG: 2-C-methyl-D-erythritol 2,4-cyclodiphosphate synthase [Mycoplasmataceae bacterium]|jgi:2-C-methyl-D-erythritol 2,4-cyclodiphosphate synthase|nr:2-C-methyl-D-erythritol 2,4-cyclodiphosphate synthase [Mycoplasmataceae bacterium]